MTDDQTVQNLKADWHASTPGQRFTLWANKRAEGVDRKLVERADLELKKEAQQIAMRAKYERAVR